MKRVLVTVALVAAGFTATLLTVFTEPAGASAPQYLTIHTSKAPGPVPGTFTASGAFVDSGTINNLKFHPTAVLAPTFLVSHITILFTGVEGTFVLKTQITETLTSDPNVLTSDGTWAIINGTGAYARLHGQGTVAGTLDENVGLITRVFHGDVHLD